MTDSVAIDGRVARGMARRRAIAEAVVDVVAAHGLRGLTHRRVAEVAGVPLGSTTYHFATLDDLISAGLELAADRNLALMRSWAERVTSAAEIATWLTDLVIEMVTTWHDHNVAERELYLEAIRSPALRPIANRWDDECAAILTPHVGSERAARLVVWAIDGLAVSLLMADQPPDRERILSRLALLCDSLTSGIGCSPAAIGEVESRTGRQPGH